MKKTLTINLGGLVFHIDEDAYTLLNQYLENLKYHFSKQQGAEDILDDIESRMAEILQDRQSETKEVITYKDVTEVIAIMGQPTEMDPEEHGKSGDNLNDGEKGAKRFFRNPDEKIIAGVCSGIAAYFHFDPVWVRLAFLIFIAAGGSGILLYIVLWFVIPQAQSTTDKLEMRGKKINIPNIEKSVKEELSDIRSRIGNLATESATTLRRAGAGSDSFFEGIRTALIMVFKYIGKALVLLTGVVFIVTGIALLMALFAYTLGWSGGIYSDSDFHILAFPAFAKLLIGCNMPVNYLQIIILIVLGIPAAMLFYNGLRMVFRFERIKYLGLAMLNIWIIGLFFLVWSGLRIFNLYKYHDENRLEIALENPSCDTLFVSLFPDDPGIKYLANDQYELPGDQRVILAEHKQLYVVPNIRIEESEDSLFTITQTTVAHGKSNSEAHQHLTDIRFQSAMVGSVLKISPFAKLPREECWRGQAVKIEIRVPQGKFIQFDEGLKQRLTPSGWYHPDRVGTP